MGEQPKALTHPVQATFGMIRDGSRLWAAFTAVTPEAKMQAEDLRQQFCDVCRNTPDLALRMSICQKKRCGLMDSTAFLREWYALIGLLDRVQHLDSAESRDLVALNDYIEEAGAVTPAITRDAEGFYRRGYSLPTLRAALHASLVDILTFRAGDMIHAHAHQLRGARAGAELAAVAVRASESYDMQRACELRREGVGVAEIMRRLKYSRGTIKKWLVAAGLSTD